MSSGERSSAGKDVNKLASAEGGFVLRGHDMADVEEGMIVNGDSERRGFLRGTAGSVVAGVLASIGLSSPAAAKRRESRKKAKAARQEYSEYGAAKRAVSTTGAAVLRELHENQYIDSPTVAGLAFHGLDSMSEYVGASEGSVVVGTISDDTPTASIFVKRRIDGGKLVVNVQPQYGSAHAIIQFDESDRDDVVITAEGDQAGTSDVSTHGGCYAAMLCVYTCPTVCGCYKQEFYCCDGACNAGDIMDTCPYSGTTCDCSDDYNYACNACVNCS